MLLVSVTTLLITYSFSGRIPSGTQAPLLIPVETPPTLGRQRFMGGWGEESLEATHRSQGEQGVEGMAKKERKTPRIYEDDRRANPSTPPSSLPKSLLNVISHERNSSTDWTTELSSRNVETATLVQFLNHASLRYVLMFPLCHALFLPFFPE